MEAGSTSVTLDTALDRVGFGLYSYLLLVLSGLVIIAFAFVVYSNTVLIPLSACELKTTSAQQGLLAAMPSIGSIIGALFWGYLGDTRGRRNVLLVSLLLGAVLNALSSLSVNWIMLIIIQTIASVLVSGQYPISMTLLSECVPVDKRNMVLILVTSIFLFSQGLMAVIAMPIAPLGFSHYIPLLGIYWTPWRAIALIYSIPSVICLVWMYFMQDSPKFVLENNETARALKILQAIHKVNHLVSGKTFEVTGLIRKYQGQPTQLTVLQRLKPFVREPLRKKVIIITTLYAFQLMWPFKVWLPTIANQVMSVIETGQGSDRTLCRLIHLSLEAPSEGCSLNSTALTLVLVVCAVQSAANLILSPFLRQVGRRNMVVLITSVCGISGIFVNIFPNVYISAILFTIQLIGMICMGYYTAIAISVYPTAFRAMGVAIAVTGNRISMFFSVQILKYMLQNYCELGFFIFCALFTSSSFITMLLPNDKKSAVRLTMANSVFGRSMFEGLKSKNMM